MQKNNHTTLCLNNEELVNNKNIIQKIYIAAYDELSESVIIFNKENKIIGCNWASVKMFAYRHKEEMLNLSAYSLVYSSHKSRVDSAISNQVYVNKEIYLLRKDRTIFMAKTQSKFSNINSQIVRIVSIIDLSQTIKEHALDSLTSLQTRKTLELDFNNMMREYKLGNKNACAIFVDIDNFKLINDTLGHQFGDTVLKAISKILTSGVRKSDLVIRWGGDEFLLLLLDAEIKEAKKIALQLRNKINNLSLDGYADFTCSFGLDVIKKNDTIDKVTNRIDEALLKAKKSLKNCVVEYT